MRSLQQQTLQTDVSTLACVYLTVVVSILIPSTSSQKVLITPLGNQIATIDSDVTVTCTIFDYRVPTNRKSNLKITWYGPDSKEITRTTQRMNVVRVDSYALRMTITKIAESDAGIYRCQATDSSSGLQLSNETNIFVYQDIEFDDTPTLERHLLGSTAFLQCTARGIPKPDVSWYFGNRLIIADGSKYVFLKNGLSIYELDLRDSGRYECRATVTRIGNFKSRNITLDILFPPVIMRPPAVDKVIRGQKVILQCRADGNPPVKYEWLKDQKVTDKLSSKVILHEKSDTFTIARVTSDDEGRYYCRVSNDYGSKEMHVDIKMMIPPTIKALPYRASVLEGNALTVTCEASGTPVPTITWNQTSNDDQMTKDKQQLIRVGRWLENLQPGLNSLTLRGVERSFAGWLHCSAGNLAGSDTKMIPLIVEYRPTVELPQPEVFAWAGERRSLRCKTDGVPAPTVTWLRDRQPIQNSYIYQIANTQIDGSLVSVLTIRPPTSVEPQRPSPYGLYQCVAKNLHGIGSGFGKLLEAVTPEVVRNVSVLEETPTTVTLRATPPSSSASHIMPLLTWMVKYELADNGFEQRTHEFNFSTESLVITDLNPGTTYTFYLSISNAVGFSNPLKFRVTTPRKLNLNQQSDVPGRSDDEEKWKETETKTDERDLKRGESKIEIAADRSLISNRDMIIILIATAIGFLIVILSIITAVVCVSWRKKKLIHRHSCTDPPPTSSSSRRASSDPKENRIVLHPMWQPSEDTLPDILRNDCTTTSTTTTAATPRDRIKRAQEVQSECSTPRYPIGRSGSLTCGSFLGASAAASRKPNIRTLQHQQRSFDDTSFSRISKRGLRPTDECFDLPPPPAFLLYPNADEEGIKGPGMRGRGFSHGELLDGYQSGDNVDDDIDQVDYTIRMPSVHSQLFNYS